MTADRHADPVPPDTAPASADFLTVNLPDGGTWTRLDRLTDGRVMCCLCFEHVTRDQLATDPDDGQLTDICQPCAAQEAGATHA